MPWYVKKQQSKWRLLGRFLSTFRWSTTTSWETLSQNHPAKLCTFECKLLKNKCFYFSCCCSVAKSCSILGEPMDCSKPGFTISWSLLKLTSIESMMPSNHLILCLPLRPLPSIFPSLRIFSSESAFLIRWSKYWSFSFSISPSNEYSELISFRIYWFYLLAIQEILKSLFQYHNSKASILQLYFSWVYAKG